MPTLKDVAEFLALNSEQKLAAKPKAEHTSATRRWCIADKTYIAAGLALWQATA
jgi:hypothetical protein